VRGGRLPPVPRLAFLLGSFLEFLNFFGPFLEVKFAAFFGPFFGVFSGTFFGIFLPTFGPFYAIYLALFGAPLSFATRLKLTSVDSGAFLAALTGH
jgi:hypothetical protein